MSTGSVFEGSDCCFESGTATPELGLPSDDDLSRDLSVFASMESSCSNLAERRRKRLAAQHLAAGGYSPHPTTVRLDTPPCRLGNGELKPEHEVPPVISIVIDPSSQLSPIIGSPNSVAAETSIWCHCILKWRHFIAVMTLLNFNALCTSCFFICEKFKKSLSACTIQFVHKQILTYQTQCNWSMPLRYDVKIIIHNVDTSHNQ